MSFTQIKNCLQQKVLQQVWLDKLTSANCKARHWFRAGQTSLIISSYLQQIISISSGAGRTQF